MVNVAVVAGINIDILALVDRQPDDDHPAIIHSVAEGPGGKGANQAVAAAQRGASVRLLGAVGRDDVRAFEPVIARSDVVVVQLESSLDAIRATLELAVAAGVPTLLDIAPAQRPLRDLLLAEGNPPSDAARWAGAASTLACRRLGAQSALATRAEIEAIL